MVWGVLVKAPRLGAGENPQLAEWEGELGFSVCNVVN